MTKTPPDFVPSHRYEERVVVTEHPFADSPQFKQQKRANGYEGLRVKDDNDQRSRRFFDKKGELVETGIPNLLPPDSESARSISQEVLDRGAANLTEKQRFVLGRRTGQWELGGDGYRYTQEEIAAMMGITQQKVAATEERALKSLEWSIRLGDDEQMPTKGTFSGLSGELGKLGGSLAHELAPAGFVIQKHQRCDDCDLRGALAADGHVLTVNGHRLSCPCETCDGRGSLPSALGRDPYARAA